MWPLSRHATVACVVTCALVLSAVAVSPWQRGVRGSFSLRAALREQPKFSADAPAADASTGLKTRQDGPHGRGSPRAVQQVVAEAPDNAPLTEAATSRQALQQRALGRGGSWSASQKHREHPDNATVAACTIIRIHEDDPQWVDGHAEDLHEVQT